MRNRIAGCLLAGGLALPALAPTALAKDWSGCPGEQAVIAALITSRFDWAGNIFHSPPKHKIEDAEELEERLKTNRKVFLAFLATGGKDPRRASFVVPGKTAKLEELEAAVDARRHKKFYDNKGDWGKLRVDPASISLARLAEPEPAMSLSFLWHLRRVLDPSTDWFDEVLYDYLTGRSRYRSIRRGEGVRPLDCEELWLDHFEDYQSQGHRGTHERSAVAEIACAPVRDLLVRYAQLELQVRALFEAAKSEGIGLPESRSRSLFGAKEVQDGSFDLRLATLPSVRDDPAVKGFRAVVGDLAAARKAAKKSQAGQVSITLETDPPGAVVYRNLTLRKRERLGKTWSPLKLKLEPGNYWLTFEPKGMGKPGIQRTDSWLDVKGPGPIHETVKMKGR